MFCRDRVDIRHQRSLKTAVDTAVSTFGVTSRPALAATLLSFLVTNPNIHDERPVLMLEFLPQMAIVGQCFF